MSLLKSLPFICIRNLREIFSISLPIVNVVQLHQQSFCLRKSLRCFMRKKKEKKLSTTLRNTELNRLSDDLTIWNFNKHIHYEFPKWGCNNWVPIRHMMPWKHPPGILKDIKQQRHYSKTPPTPPHLFTGL
jgi:hypothetical protein